MNLTSANNNYLNTPALGYMVNTFLDTETQSEVNRIQKAFEDRFGEAIWSTPAKTLHVTLMDWLAPLVDYSQNKDLLFDEIFAQYDKALSECLQDLSIIDVEFNHMIVSDSAIAIVADEKSTAKFNAVREKFLNKINLIDGTKQPASILHSTIIRFVDSIPKKDVEQFANSYALKVPTKVTKFTLIRESVVPMMEFGVKKTYALNE